MSNLVKRVESFMSSINSGMSGRISIVDGMAVKIAIVLTRMECSILLWDEEEWGSLWGFGRYNASSLEMFIDEILAGLLFGGVKRINFCDLGDKGVLEFNGVIEGLMRGQNIIGFL